MGLPYRILARIKSPYSIWNKMQNKHITFEEIYDILAVRIIFTPKNEEEELNDCFNIYVAIPGYISLILTVCAIGSAIQKPMDIRLFM